MSAKAVFQNNHCEVVVFPYVREFTEREKKAMTDAGYRSIPTYSRMFSTMEQQHGIIVYAGKDGKRLGELIYTSWAFASCSSASLSGLERVVVTGVNHDEFRNDFIEAIDFIQSSGYNPHRFFANVVRRDAADNSYYRVIDLLWKCFKKQPEPVYDFENEAHSSQTNHLYDISTHALLAWREDYHAKKNAAGGGPVKSVDADWLPEFAGEATANP